MTTFALPDLGEGLQEAEIVSWHVTVGDRVITDQPLVAVETEKAVVEIPAPYAGVITRLHAEPGTVVAIGAPLADFGSATATDTGTVVGQLPTTEPPRVARAPIPEGTRVGAAPVRAAPAARRRAQELGLDLANLRGSGPEGIVTLSDVDAAGTHRLFEGGQPLRGIRRSMARAMALAHAAVVPATVTEEADVTAWPQDTDPTVRLVRAIVHACAIEPALNAWLDGSRQVRRVHERIDLGLAVDAPDGLLVPVLRAVAQYDAQKLRDEIDRLVAGARDRSLPPEAFRGATITLSNFGMLGGLHAALVVVPPQVAILGVGRFAPQVVLSEGGPRARQRLPLSLTFDHRGVNGGEATRFLIAAKRHLERGT